MEKHVDIIKDRIAGVTNDLKTYIDLRKDNRQHGNNEYSDNLGGGNMVMAMGLFASLGLLGKSQVCVAANERGNFDELFDNRGHAIDEQKIFVEFVQFLDDKVNLLDPRDKSKTSYRKIWERFRDFTSHVLVPDQGNSVLTFIWDSPQKRSADEILTDIKKQEDTYAFERHNGTWIVNVDKLLSLLGDITAATSDYLISHNANCSKNCAEALEKVLWR